AVSEPWRRINPAQPEAARSVALLWPSPSGRREINSDPESRTVERPTGTLLQKSYLAFACAIALSRSSCALSAPDSKSQMSLSRRYCAGVAKFTFCTFVIRD